MNHCKAVFKCSTPLNVESCDHYEQCMLKEGCLWYHDGICSNITARAKSLMDLEPELIIEINELEN
jgi:hypothetical protein